MELKNNEIKMTVYVNDRYLDGNKPE